MGLQPLWRATAHTAVRLRLDMNRRDYRGPIVAVPELREDTIRAAQFGVTWQPRLTLSADAYVAREQRSSSLDGLDYRDNIAGFSIELKF